MTLETIRDALGWCIVFDVIFLFVWGCAFAFMHDWMYRMHVKWFKMSVETFDAIHYAGMALFKMGMILTALVPYLALRIVG
ncbi:MAG: hypothetical protein AMXMBFR84_15420 [Candidatus Hydrogenedentota bacterium]